MRRTSRFTVVICVTLVVLVAIIAGLIAKGIDVEVIASIVVTSIIPTIGSLIALERSRRRKTSRPDTKTQPPKTTPHH